MNAQNTFEYEADEEVVQEAKTTESDTTNIETETVKVAKTEEDKPKPEEAGTELVSMEDLKIVEIFKTGGADPLLENIEKQAESIIADVTTEKGRKELASMAYKIATSKTALDKAGKELKDKPQKIINEIDAERKKIRDRMDALKDKVRAPLTEFQEREKQRVADHENRMVVMENQADFGSFKEPDCEEISYAMETVGKVYKYDIDNTDVDWEEFSERAASVYRDTIEKLNAMFERRKKYETEQAELEKLRKEKEEREAEEERVRIREAAAAKATKEAEEKAAIDAKVTKDKSDKEAADKAAAAKAEQDRLQKEKDDADAALKKAEDDRIEAAAKAKQDKEDAVQAEKDAAAEAQKKLDDAQAKREADQKHKSKINNEALDAITKITARTPAQDNPAQRIVEAIAKGEIPHVKITY